MIDRIRGIIQTFVLLSNNEQEEMEHIISNQNLSESIYTINTLRQKYF